uniref:Uncharacterized protein n=1 Tax=Glossina morsitans morsitans TaxID=37546 RepID=A0A1B0GEY8_GLOMM
MPNIISIKDIDFMNCRATTIHSRNSKKFITKLNKVKPSAFNSMHSGVKRLFMYTYEHMSPPMIQETMRKDISSTTSAWPRPFDHLGEAYFKLTAIVLM